MGRIWKIDFRRVNRKSGRRPSKKKKHLSRYGKIEISKEHSWSEAVNGYSITPYMQDLMLYAGQKDNYLLGQKEIEKYLQVTADDCQIRNLVTTYGEFLELKEEQIAIEQEKQSAELATKVGDTENAYAMIDGSFVLSRDDGGGWREMKLGRVFVESDLFEIQEKRRWLRNSIYTAHFGDCGTFADKFEPVVDKFESLKDRLVFINDGACWIWKWVTEMYPNATQILDYFHACEYLTDFTKAIFKKEESRKKWVQTQKTALLNDEIEKVIQRIEAKKTRGVNQQAAKDKILGYYQKNKHRMKYQTFKDKNLLIGSGAIESAHRVVIQKRMKQSGQRWTIKGGQQVVNLRVAHLNNQWDNVIQLINRKQRA